MSTEVNKFDKIKSFCSKFRIIIGLVLIIYGAYSVNFDFSVWTWWYLGVVPLIAGLTKFCPICIFSKKCSI